MVEGTISILDWIKEAVKTRAGIFTIGMLIGVIPSATMSFIFYKDSEFTEKRLLIEFDRNKAIELEKDLWQERAFDAENTCLEKLRSMAVFFQDIESLYGEEALDSRESVEKKQIELKLLEDLKNQTHE